MTSGMFIVPGHTVTLEHGRSSRMFIRHAKTQGSSWNKDRQYVELLDSEFWHQIAGFGFGPLPLSSSATLEESFCALLFICTRGLMVVLTSEDC